MSNQPISCIPVVTSSVESKNRYISRTVKDFHLKFLAATCSYVTLPFRPWVCEWVCEFVSEWVCYAEMSQKTALFYKNIIRNAKLRKLTSEDFFKKKIIIISNFFYFFLLFFFFLKWSPKFLFYFTLYKILWRSVGQNIFGCCH